MSIWTMLNGRIREHKDLRHLPCTAHRSPRQRRYRCEHPRRRGPAVLERSQGREDRRDSHLYNDRQGRKKESSKYYVEIKDHLERVQRIPGFTDKKASMEFGRKLEKLVSFRIADERPTGDMGRWIESLPFSIRNRLIQKGILIGRCALSSRPIKDHIQGWKIALKSKGNTPGHVQEEVARVTRIYTTCKFHYWSDISATKIAVLT